MYYSLLLTVIITIQLQFHHSTTTTRYWLLLVLLLTVITTTTTTTTPIIAPLPLLCYWLLLVLLLTVITTTTTTTTPIIAPLPLLCYWLLLVLLLTVITTTTPIIPPLPLSDYRTTTTFGWIFVCPILYVCAVSVSVSVSVLVLARTECKLFSNRKRWCLSPCIKNQVINQPTQSIHQSILFSLAFCGRSVMGKPTKCGDLELSKGTTVCSLSHPVDFF